MADEKEKKASEKSMENEKIKLFSSDHRRISTYFRRHVYLLAETANQN